MEIARYSDEINGDLHRLTREFHKESLDEYGMSYDKDALQATIDAIKDESYFMMVDGKCQGMLAGKEVFVPTSKERYWHEIAWFVNKDYRRHGMKLLNEVKKILKADGFDTIVMVRMHNSKSDKLHDLYTRIGMTPMETHYIGRL